MRAFLFIVAITSTLAVVLQCPGLSAPAQKSSVAQYGMEFVFDKAYTVGQYANGDYWVLGPVTITQITPDFTGTTNGFEVNPDSTTQNGFDSRIDEFNATRVPKLPLKVYGISSVVKTVSVKPGDCRPCLEVATVLTVVSSIPADNGLTSFRPGYFGFDKTFVSTATVDTSLLPKLDGSSLKYPLNVSYVAVNFEKVQLDHRINWEGRKMHPIQNMPAYGADIGIQTGQGGLRILQSDILESDVGVCGLVRYMQAGLDYYSMLRNGMTWPANGGHDQGRKLPLSMTAWLLNDAALASLISKNVGQKLDVFQEDGECYFGTAKGDISLWGSTTQCSETTYWAVAKTGDGNRICADPYKLIDGGPAPGTYYQVCCNSQPWKAAALVLNLFPTIKKTWNYPAYSNYVERWVSSGVYSQPDDCAPMLGKCATGGAPCSSANYTKACGSTDIYSCAYMDPDGKNFGPDGKGGCIKDTDPSDGIGRFPQLHGTDVDGGDYGSKYTSDMFSTFYKKSSQ